MVPVIFFHFTGNGNSHEQTRRNMKSFRKEVFSDRRMAGCKKIILIL